MFVVHAVSFWGLLSVVAERRHAFPFVCLWIASILGVDQGHVSQRCKKFASR